MGDGFETIAARSDAPEARLQQEHQEFRERQNMAIGFAVGLAFSGIITETPGLILLCFLILLWQISRSFSMFGVPKIRWR